MSERRRYDDQEIAEILDLATQESARRPFVAPSEGLTLDEIEEIGSEVGIEPGRIVNAAHAVDRRAHEPPVERYLGATRSVSRTVRIERGLSEEEWARLVADLRRTFNAKGRVESHGELRSWTNSNLQVHIEPEGTGYAVRMSTRKGNATQLSIMGAVFSVMGIVTGAGIALGMTDDTLAKATLLTALGLGLIGWVRATLPGWARRRAEQMEGLAERVPLLLDE